MINILASLPKSIKVFNDFSKYIPPIQLEAKLNKKQAGAELCQAQSSQKLQLKFQSQLAVEVVLDALDWSQFLLLWRWVGGLMDGYVGGWRIAE